MNKKTLASIICLLAVAIGAYFLFSSKRPNVNEPLLETSEQSTATSTNQEIKTANSQAPSIDDEKDIRFAFEQYKTAILNRNSSLAIKYLDQTTINYYADMLNLIKKGTKAEIQNRRLLDQVTILIVRHLFDRTTISQLSGGVGMLDLAIKEGLIGEQSVSGLSIHSVKISGNVAFIEVKTDHGVAPQKFKFVKENGVWKIDLTSIFPESNIILESVAKNAGLTNEEFIFQILEAQSGTRPSDAIWNPLF